MLGDTRVIAPAPRANGFGRAIRQITTIGASGVLGRYVALRSRKGAEIRLDGKIGMWP